MKRWMSSADQHDEVEMSTVVRFLEGLGRGAPVSDYPAAVSGLRVSEAQRDALIDGDVDALYGLLGARKEMRCLIFSGEGEIRT